MKKKLITYPSRIESELIRKVNKVRKEHGITWQKLTRELLEAFLRVQKK